METKVNYTVVGGFVIFLVTAIVVGILWLSSGLSYGEYKTYLVYMRESVSGLSVDSKVEFNGVGIGNVKSIELNQKNPRLVEVLINIKSSTKITKGTEATLTTRGLTGLAFVALKDTSSDLRPLEIEEGEVYPVIKTAPSLFVRLDALLSGLSKNFHDVSESLKILFDKDNTKTIKSSLNNIEKITANLANNSNTLNSILKNTQRSIYELTPLIKTTNGAVQMLQEQTLPNVARLLENLDNISNNLNEVTTDIKQNPSILIRGAGNPALGPGEK